MFGWITKRRVKMRCLELAAGLAVSGEYGTQSAIEIAKGLEKYILGE